VIFFLRKAWVFLFSGATVVFLLIFLVWPRKNDKIKAEGYLIGFNFKEPGGVKILNLQTGGIFPLCPSEGIPKRRPALAPRKKLLFYIEEKEKKLISYNLMHWGKTVVDNLNYTGVSFSGMISIDPEEKLLLLLEDWHKGCPLKVYQLGEKICNIFPGKFFLPPVWQKNGKFISAENKENPQFVELDPEKMTKEILKDIFPKNYEIRKFSPNLEIGLAGKKATNIFVDIKNNKIFKTTDFSEFSGYTNNIIFVGDKKVVLHQSLDKSFIGYYLYDLETGHYSVLTRRESLSDASFIPANEYIERLISELRERRRPF
jgi:hypothetical protein